MKRFHKKTVACALCALLACSTASVFAGCGGDSGEKIDESRSQIYIGAYDGGYGEMWLESLKVRFEEAYKDVSFQDGRVGVQVRYICDKDMYTPGYLLSTINQDKNEVYFASGNDVMGSYISSNLLMDITDVVTEPLTEFGETRSIEDKMDAQQISHYKRNGKYYMLPDKETAQGVIYDVDLFESKQYYFAKGGCPSEFSAYTQANNENPAEGSFSKYKYTGTGEKSAGPDGKYGTYDDGCPATYAEFEQLMKLMSNKATKSFIWYDVYQNFLMTALAIDYHGVDAGGLLYTGGGTEGVEAEIVTGFDNAGEPIVETKKISLSNYEDVSRMVGYYYGLEMMETLIDGKYYAAETKQGISHVETQQVFLRSSLNGKQPIAMLLDGTWWDSEAEASGAFAECERDFPGKLASRADRKFGLMPMPKYSEDKIGEQTTIYAGSAHVFAKANVAKDKVELIKTFLRFVYTDATMAESTVASGVPIAMDYELSEENTAKMNYFAKQYWNISSTSAKVWGYVAPSIQDTDLSTHYFNFSNFHSFDSDGLRRREYVSLLLEGDSITAREYFEGMWIK